ncbi:Uncharacterized protein BP5553_07155 [Venustampulla echinocandica]|uniref:LPXTG-domain-containing protein n=1 Tax=Venustampulla echinocandica TaxID=2656787 RepID=A0A370TIN1_9HELO|nr:Uncharacterized protein BP5553_07155 [Venustampulla echinocandica]RDL35224.1 Uncharacterized protein BP5553_07155 [Venustampulla echinocandica]
MRPSLAAPTLVLLTTFAPSTLALQSISSSPCAVQCGNVQGNTTGSDIACRDDTYGALPGLSFETCVKCQLTSTYVDPATKQTDLRWGLYNLRYAVSWCLFGYPNNTNAGSTPCKTGPACGPLESAFEFDSLSPAAGTYSFCPTYSADIVGKCNLCLANQHDQIFLRNFATVLNAACQQQPTPGKTISIEGSVFSSDAVNITNPSSIPTSSFNGPATGGLNLGSKIGIAVGAILLFLIITGFCIIWNGKRRRRRILRQRQRESGYSDWRQQHHFQDDVGAHPPQGTPQMQDGSSSAGGFFDSPQSTRPLMPSRPWATGAREEESPVSAVGEKAYFSPYSSHYSSPVSAHDQLQMSGMEWPMDRKGSASGYGGGKGKMPEKVEREPEGDQIEMQNVAPVLLHPGHGRGGSAGLDGDDSRRGNAL